MDVALEVVGACRDGIHLVGLGVWAREDLPLEQRAGRARALVDRHVVHDASVLVVELDREGLDGGGGQASLVESDVLRADLDGGPARRTWERSAGRGRGGGGGRGGRAQRGKGVGELEWAAR